MAPDLCSSTRKFEYIASHGPGIGYSDYTNQVKYLDAACPTLLESEGNGRYPDAHVPLGGKITRTRKLQGKEVAAAFDAPDDLVTVTKQFGLTYAWSRGSLPVLSHVV